MKLTIGFVGMTHLGLIYSLASAYKNFKTFAYEDDPNLINSLRKKQFPIKEPELIKTFEKCKKYLNFTYNAKDLKSCNIVFFSYDVPTDNSGKSNLSFIEKKIDETISKLNKKAIFVILCQVTPGFTRKVNWPTDQKFYQVETLVFGEAIKRAIFPERIIVGCESKKITKSYENFLKSFNCPILKMNYESAELTKISINICLISNISVANTLSEICEKIGANWNDIIPALKMDKRIGEYSYLKPGLGIAGGNLERDLKNIQNISQKKNIHGKIIDAFSSNSQYYSKWVYRKIKEVKCKSKRIAIWGITYKENTHSYKNSPSLKNIKLLNDYNINLYDPVVKLNDLKLTSKNFINMYDCLVNCEILIIFTPWKEFKDIDIEKFKKSFRGNLILDPYNTLQNVNLGKNIKIVSRGC